MEGIFLELKIVYDNTIFLKNIGLKSDWGFSCLIKTINETVLFDSGAKGNILLNNMKKLGIDPKGISKIVISHEHWDHNGGLKDLLAYLKKDIPIYRFNCIKSKKLICKTVSEPIKISKNVYSTGRMPGHPVDEQSLILMGKKGFFALAGCSHNDVKNILKKGKEYGKIIGIIGGLHGFSEFEILKNLDLICPTHCTKHIKEIKNRYPESYIPGGVGRKIEI